MHAKSHQAQRRRIEIRHLAAMHLHADIVADTLDILVLLTPELEKIAVPAIDIVVKGMGRTFGTVRGKGCPPSVADDRVVHHRVGPDPAGSRMTRLQVRPR